MDNTSQRWPLYGQAVGIDHLGNRVVEKIGPIAPPLYFWLGAEADPQWPVIRRLVVQ